jgi:transposase
LVEAYSKHVEKPEEMPWEKIKEICIVTAEKVLVNRSKEKRQHVDQKQQPKTQKNKS